MSSSSSSPRSSHQSRSSELNFEQLKQKVKKARDEKKIFIIYAGYGPLRQALIERGWLEKVPNERIQFMNGKTEDYIIANMLRTSPFYFIWQPKSRPVILPGVKPPVFVNSVYRRHDLDFTSKEGLINLEKNMNWFTIEGVSQLTMPRTFILSDREGREDFIQDFKRTNFISFIMFMAKSKCKNFKSFFTSADDGISHDIIELAVLKVEILVRIKNHDDIDIELVETCSRLPRGRDIREENMKKIIKGSKLIKMPNEMKFNDLLKSVMNCSEKIISNWPERRYDGYKNIWVLKPIGASSGNGITVMADENSILKAAMTTSSRFVVQKYIERPMLIQGRKFDIRVYFMTLIRDGFVDVWIYRNCYLKFGTHKFNLNILDRSIHVTNHAVQKYFMNQSDAVTNAVENMWPLKEFLRHLEYLEKPNLWAEKIYPRIKQNLIAVISQSLETTTLEINNFELNGADFMITYDHEPILIEINSRPALFFTPNVVEMITGKLLEDVIKVTVDFQADITSSTGDFELAHVFEIPSCALMANLSIEGTKLELGASPRRSKKSSVKVQRDVSNSGTMWIAPDLDEHISLDVF